MQQEPARTLGLIAIECQNPHRVPLRPPESSDVIRIFTAFHGTATALMLQLFVCQAAVEKTADDPCIDCLRSNATTGGFHGHIHDLADATTFPGQFCEQEINIQTLLPWTDPSTELATLHFRQPLLSFLNIPLVTPPSALFATSKLGHPLAVDCLRCHGLKPSDLQNFAWIAWPQSTNNTPTLSPNPAGRSTYKRILGKVSSNGCQSWSRSGGCDSCRPPEVVKGSEVAEGFQNNAARVWAVSQHSCFCCTSSLLVCRRR